MRFVVLTGWHISGSLTRVGSFSSTAERRRFLSFGVAVNDRRRNQQTGEWEDVPNLVDTSSETAC